LAFVIVDWTHTVCGSEMEAASAAISSLGLGLDLIEHTVLMHIRVGARRSGGASARMAGAGDWMEARTREVAARLQGATTARSDCDGRKKRANGVNPDPSHSIYRGVH
jgi:hypothetical protein